MLLISADSKTIFTIEGKKNEKPIKGLIKLIKRV